MKLKILKSAFAFIFKTTTTVSKEKIQDPVFPLYFSIILKEGFNLANLKLHGYQTAYRFYLGHKLPYLKPQPFDWQGVGNSTVQSRGNAFQCLALVL